MKVCCCSRSYAHALQSGSLTQLEWIDRCVALALDGVDLGAGHFPRTDVDYLAQIKKLCVDRGLTIAAVALDDAFGGDGDVDSQSSTVESWIGYAETLGAPILRLTAGVATGSPGIAWREFIRGLKRISAAAKARNITLALESSEGSLVATPLECKRAIKECDSAWLRVALGTDAPDAEAPGDWTSLVGETVLAVTDGAHDAGPAVDALHRGGFLGFISFDRFVGDVASLEDRLTRLRSAVRT